MNNSSSSNKKIRKGDRVIVRSGASRGQAGVVLSRTEDRAIVQGLNMRKKHVKPTEQNQKGGVLELEAPIHLSNLQACTADDKPLKLKVRTTSKGERQLVYKADGKEVLHRSLKKS